MSTRQAVLLALIVAFPAAAHAAEAPSCIAQPGRAVHRIDAEVSGARAFRESFGPGWTFALVPAAHGWNIRVFDRAGMDLSQLTPPWRGTPNPREIYGWHFRNAANTGPNTGDVNAPQKRRAFLISPAVSGTGGFKPSVDAPPADTSGNRGLADSSVSHDEGRGVLTILDYDLADVSPGQKARMIRLKFSVCMNWPAPSDIGASVARERRFADCGLTRAHRLHAYLNLPALEGDFDGDGAVDIAAAAVRTRDNKRGLAICRGRTLHFIGFEGDMGELQPAYFESIDWWRLDTRREVGQGAGGTPPTLIGDGITIGKDDSSSVLIYWDGTRFQSYWQGD
jgi:hypothetical protein